MKRVLSLILVLIPLLCWGQAAKHLANVKQITHGGQNAEAYWSPDGKRLIFQATRDTTECDQQYIMNADGSDLHMVSTGKGVTTCGYFLPDGKHIVYASTHEAGPSCPARPDRSKGYVWAVYPGFDIYLADDKGKIEKKLTSTAGYDGGPVFSRDGSMMAWRAFHPDTPDKTMTYRDLLKDNLTAPMKMELWVAKGDGSNPKQITNYGCASFAPTFSPDGKTILFSSNKNKCDSRDFELFTIHPD